MKLTRLLFSFSALSLILGVGLFLAGCEGGNINIKPPDVTIETDGNGGTGGTGGGTGGTGGGTGTSQKVNSFAGVWDTTHGEIRLHEIGPYVVGDYSDEGVMLGRRDGDCVSGVFTYDNNMGIFRFTLKGGGNFEGQWGNDQGPLGAKWNGTRTLANPPKTLRNFNRAGTTTARDDDRDLFDGVYSTTWGNVKVYSRDGFLLGDYKEVGIIAAMWDGDSFVGWFTNKQDHRDVGWGDLDFNQRTAQFNGGKWGWHGEGTAGSGWNFTRQTSLTPQLDNMVQDVSCP